MKKYCLIIKKLNSIYFLIYKYMADYYRKTVNKVVNDVKLKMQLGALTLKLNENNKKIDDLIGVDKNIKKDVSTNSNQINTNTSSISSNSELISTNTGNISSNLEKLNNIENNLILVDDIYNEVFPISRFSATSKDKRIFYTQLYSNFTTNGIIKIDAKYNYVYDENYTLRHVYRFFNNRIQFKKIELDHDRSSNIINDEFEIQGIDSNQIDIAIYYENNADNKKIELVGNNTIQINYIENNYKLDMNKNYISSNKGLIETNTSSIDEIKSNLSNIDFNSGNKYSIENFFIYNIEIENNYILNKDKKSFSIFKYTLEDDFKKDSILEIDCRLLYRYNNYNHIGLLHHIFKLYDDNDNMFYEYKSLKTNAGDNLRNDTKQNDVFYMKLNADYEIIKIELILSLIDNVNETTVVNCKLYNTYKSNFLNIKYYKKINLISVNNNLGDIENSVLSNKNNISTNLIKINSNEDDILSNLNEINYLKNNKSTQYLKNVYNNLIYDSKKQISFKDEIFYEKVFDIDASINDFVEMNFKISLEYEDISERAYVKTIYQLLDENDNSLYIKSVENNEYSYYSNKIFIDENIFYNFNKHIKKIKFVIKFQKLLSSRVIYLYYIKNDNYRFILKHYSL